MQQARSTLFNANPRDKRKLQTLLAWAGLCITLGLGNIIFGQFKYAQYSSLLSEATAELARPESTISFPLLGPALNVDRQTQHISRVRLRLDFYSVVIQGGQLLTGLGALLLGYVLIRRTWPLSEDPTHNS